MVAAVLAALIAIGAPIAFAGSKRRVEPLPRGTVVVRSLDMTAIAALPDGRILEAGTLRTRRRFRFAVDRRLPGGRLDRSFVRTRIDFGQSAVVTALAVQPDGKILAAGIVKGVGPSSDGSSSDFALARLLPDGQLDASFGADGLTRADLGGDDIPSSVSLQPDGKILLAGGVDRGYPDGANPDSRFGVARFDADGKLDPAFGAEGKAVIGFGRYAHALDAFARPDGTVAVAGLHSLDPGGDQRMSIAQAQLTPGGAPNSAFGNAGVLLTPFATRADLPAARRVEGSITALAYGPDGRLVVGGSLDAATARGLMAPQKITRLGADGLPDPTFGGDGSVLLGERVPTAYDIEFSGDGKILLGGVGSAGKGASFGLFRLGPAGSLDRKFGRRGVASTPMPGLNVDIADLAIDALGRPLLGGYADPTRTYVSIIARYRPGGKLDKSFGPKRKRKKDGRKGKRTN